MFLLRFLFKRLTIVVVLLLIQICVLVSAIVHLSSQFVYVYAAFVLISLAVTLWIINRQDNPSYKLAWIVPILLFPVFGGLFYLFFGGNRMPGFMRRGMRKTRAAFNRLLTANPAVAARLEEQDSCAARQSAYLTAHSGYPPHDGTGVEYFPSGEAKFASLLEDLRRARRFIFLEYFIIGEGKMWSSVLEILEEKAAQGLDVRVMYDDIGSLNTLPDGYQQTLRKKGIKCRVFNPFRPVMSVIMNNRDHRKIVVIDGCIGYTGGINLADEYINEKERFGHWKDSALRLEGEAVWNLTVMFLSLWDYLQREPSDYEAFRPHCLHPEPFPGEGIVQPFGDSPLDNEAVGENVYLNIIGRARRYVWITTPYLIIDNEMMTALCLAAKSGVDVRIITPHVPDKWYVHMVTQAHYQQLIESGVQIYEYLPGFIHAKSFVCDDKIAAVGTINLDYRSLYLHFECGVWLCRTPCITHIRQDFLETQAKCDLIPADFGRRLPVGKRLLQAVLRLFAPLM